MRISVNGNAPSAMRVACLLSQCGYKITDLMPDYSVHVDEGNQDHVIVDGIDGDLDDAIVRHIRKIGHLDVHLQVVAQTRGEKSIRISLPRIEDRTLYMSRCDAIERAVLRGILDVTQHGVPGGQFQIRHKKPDPVAPKTWKQKLFFWRKP